MQQNRVAELEQMAHELRRDVLDMVHHAGTGHVGGSFSIAELMTALYFDVLRVDPHSPKWGKRDRLVLSKGHAAPILYAALARRGFFAPAELDTLRRLGSILQGHPDSKRTPGVDLTSGCLGEGLSNGCGFAASARLRGTGAHTFVILGDGELQEGQVWEAALFAAASGLSNLTAVVDQNGLMCDDVIEKVLPMGDIEARWRAFGWDTLSINGHDVGLVADTLRACKNRSGPPCAVLLQTVKGRGVPFMENDPAWHGAILTDELYKKAINTLEVVRAA